VIAQSVGHTQRNFVAESRDDQANFRGELFVFLLIQHLAFECRPHQGAKPVSASLRHDNPLGKFQKNLPAPQFADPQSNQLSLASLRRRPNNSIHPFNGTIFRNEFLQIGLHRIPP
jgi:hypothetical protein